MEKNIVIFTDTYPCINEGNAEAAALNSLVPILAQVFKAVILVPRLNGVYQGILPTNVYLVEDLEKHVSSKLLKLCYGVFAGKVYRELMTFPKYKWTLRLLKEVIGYWGCAIIVKNWCLNNIPKFKLSSDDTILYSFWFDATAFGVSMFGKLENYAVVTSAHGYDLFEFRHSHSVIPFRRYSMELIDEIYPDSFAGTKYLIEKYPKHKKKISTFLTGTIDPDFYCSFSVDGVFRILSISRIHPVKRLDMILEAVLIFAARFLDLKIEWNHIGGGPDISFYKSIAISKSTLNSKIMFHGAITDAELKNFLKNNPVDAFVNVSSSEGLSIALMEAMSMGIPLIATRVGGNIELLNGNNGVLLSELVTPVDLAETFEYFIANPEKVKQYRLNSRLFWEKNYNATNNYVGLSRHLFDTDHKI